MALKCLIPAAGKGTRMRPLSHSLPKAMLPVAGKPTVFHIIDKVARAGVKDFVIITGYLRELMEAEILAAYPHLHISFVPQIEQKGLGHAMLLARDHFADDDTLLVVYGDTLFEANLTAIMKSTRAMIGVFEVEDPRRFGIIELDSKGDTIVNFIEKPDKPVTNLAMPGVNYFPKAGDLFRALEKVVSDNIESKGEYQATDAYQIMLRDFKLPMGYFLIDAWDDAGTLEAMLETNRQILEREGGAILTTEIEGSEIIEPVYIAQGVVIRNSKVGPDVSIAPGCTLENVEITNSIIDIETHLKNVRTHGSLIGRYSDIFQVEGRLIIGDHCLIDGKNG